jgi:toxin HigB-1
MIISFKHKGLETFFHTGIAAGIQTIHRKRLREVLTVLHVAKGPEDLHRPSWRTHQLHGDRKGFYAI